MVLLFRNLRCVFVSVTYTERHRKAMEESESSRRVRKVYKLISNVVKILCMYIMLLILRVVTNNGHRGSTRSLTHGRCVEHMDAGGPTHGR